jgi:tetratricopeptide (TPR) repeat protein
MNATEPEISNQIARLSALGRQAAQQKEWAAVGACAERIVGLAPEDPEGHFLLGLHHKVASRPLKATEAFQRALELNPERYDAAIELAGQYSVARRNGEAAELLARYQDRLGNSPRYLDMAGTVYTEIGLPERAWPLYLKANELQPDIDLFQANLAACAVFVGEIDRAREIYTRLLQRYPAHQRNHYHLSRLGRATDAKHVDQMKLVLRQLNLPPEKNVFLYYAIGKELEDLERWDEAFRYYKRAGDAVTRVAKYDPRSDLALIDRIIEVCDAGWLAAEPRGIPAAEGGKTPVFVIGLPRTGTTLTERILCSHSRIESLGETQFMQMVIRRESGVPTVELVTPEIIEAAAGQDIRRIGQGYLDAVRYRLGERPMFIDKLPYNFLFLGFIAKAWPDARIVHLRRNPMDACFAMYKQVFTWAYKFSYSLEHLGNYYVAYLRLLDHWRQVLGGRLVEVEYEALVSDQERQTRRLLERLELDFEEACLHFERNAAPSTTASSVQVREKIHDRSVRRWTHFRDQLQPLRRILEQAGIEVE